MWTEPIPSLCMSVIVPNSVLLFEVQNPGLDVFLNREQYSPESGTDGLSPLVQRLDSRRRGLANAGSGCM